MDIETSRLKAGDFTPVDDEADHAGAVVRDDFGARFSLGNRAARAARPDDVSRREEAYRNYKRRQSTYN